MKNTIRLTFFLALLTKLFFFTATLSGQCTNKIIHFSGTKIINGTSVTVVRSGSTDSLKTYCTSVTSPYLVGFDNVNGSMTGDFTFTFSPPVDSVTLNFSGISHNNAFEEEIHLFVNGLHYNIPSVGVNNTCDAFAVLTTAGDIAGCNPCAVSGWSGTTIKGPVNNIRVLDTVLFGTPYGALFSINFCNGYATKINSLISKTKMLVYPNPATDELNISSDYLNSNITLYNIRGEKIDVPFSTTKNIITLDISNLDKGIYYLRLVDNNNAVTRKVLKE
ncbi:MAG: T9SS type A sorting domain-containing protein [Bacteroidia bacterium]|nr:T9SS type A sorting domain-containing protein [Bacteroidia bacterium]